MLRQAQQPPFAPFDRLRDRKRNGPSTPLRLVSFDRLRNRPSTGSGTALRQAQGPQGYVGLERVGVGREPGGFDLEGGGEGLVGVDVSDEFCHAIALKGHVVDGLAEERIAFGIQRLDRHIHRLLIRQQEQVSRGL